jgi:hypothetical protein
MCISIPAILGPIGPKHSSAAPHYISCIHSKAIIPSNTLLLLGMSKHEKQRGFTDLVVVCCHAIYKGGDLPPYHEQAWELQSFQKSAASKPGEHETFCQHMLASLHLQIAKPTSLVIFSGGPTNSRYPELSEAKSYLQALRQLRDVVDCDILLEEAATDSYQNVLFSVLAFRKYVGYYPNQITIITHAFKEKRFLELHAKALRWPSDRFRVFGINPPFSSKLINSLP